MNELERQRVARIAMDLHAQRMQHERPPPSRFFGSRATTLAAVGVAAVVATTVAQFLH